MFYENRDAFKAKVTIKAGSSKIEPKLVQAVVTMNLPAGGQQTRSAAGSSRWPPLRPSARSLRRVHLWRQPRSRPAEGSLAGSAGDVMDVCCWDRQTIPRPTTRAEGLELPVGRERNNHSRLLDLC